MGTGGPFEGSGKGLGDMDVECEEHGRGRRGNVPSSRPVVGPRRTRSGESWTSGETRRR